MIVFGFFPTKWNLKKLDRLIKLKIIPNTFVLNKTYYIFESTDTNKTVDKIAKLVIITC